MTDIFTQGIIEDLDRRQSGQAFDIEVDQFGVPRYVPKADMMQPFEGAQDQTDPFAIAGEVTPVTPAEFAEKTFEVGVGAVGGTVATAIGTPGDIAGIIKGVADAAGAEEGKRFEAFLTGLSNVSSVIGSERAIGIFEEAVNALPIDEAAKQNIMAGSKYIGEVAGIPVGGGALMSGARRYAAGAPARVAERGTGMTLQSGLDPMAAVDEAIVGFSRAREVRPPTETEPGIIVFHGSGSDFDRFQLSKIGTGEGAQAFGRGLYFTDLENVAKFYRDAVGMGKEVTYKGRKLKDIDSDAMSPEEQLAVMVGQQDTKEAMQILTERELARARKNLSGIEQAISDYKSNPDAYPLKFSGMEIDETRADELKEFFESQIEAAKEVEKNIDGISTKPLGKVYQAKLKVDPKKLLDYDKPISAQNSFVRGRIEELVQEINLDDAVNLGFDPFEMGEEAALRAARESMLDLEVLTFLNTWRDIRGVEGAAEELLDKYGIKGIKYKAMQGAGARNVPETGAQNYVIFDENLIDIMKKYGIVGPVAVSAAMAGQEQMDQGEAQ